MEKIFKINYTFNYNGRPTSSFNNAYEGLVRILGNCDSKIPIEIIFPLTTALSKEQKDLIDQALIEYKREPIFHKNIEKRAA